jgi:hypothetical protein
MFCSGVLGRIRDDSTSRENASTVTIARWNAAVFIVGTASKKVALNKQCDLT